MAADPEEQLGTGAPRSDLDARPAADERSDDAGEPTIQPISRLDGLADPGVVTAAATGSHPALPDDVEPNRSGSGGSGGSATDESAETEGSTGKSNEELLSGPE